MANDLIKTDFTTLLVNRLDNGLVVVTLNRPEAGNAANTDMGLAETIKDNAPLAVRQAKKAIHEGLQMDVRTALRFEVEAYNRLTGTEDRAEGTLAWNEKRKPVFKGR